LAIVGVAVLGCGGRKTSDARAFRPLTIGDPAPAYQVVTLAGDTVRLGAAGPVTLLNVWATWCESCRDEMQDLEMLHHDFAGRGLRVIAVSVDDGDGSRVRRYADLEKLTFPIGHDPDGLVQQLYNTVGVPESYLIGRDGHLLWRQAGGLHGDAAAARAAVEQALR
jgi:peroxiredoxin